MGIPNNSNHERSLTNIEIEETLLPDSVVPRGNSRRCAFSNEESERQNER